MCGRALRSVMAVLLVVGLFACDGDDGVDDTAEVPTVDAIYAAVLRHLEIPPGPDDEPPIVYVVDLDGEPISLDDQVAIIQELDGTYDVQFFDDLDAVSEIDEDGNLVPPADGTLVVIGAPISDDDGPDDRVTVRVELIPPDGEPLAWQLTLDGTGTDMHVVASNQTQPERLVDPATP